MVVMRRQHGRTPDRLIVAFEKSEILSDTIAKWQEHIARTEAHSPQTCRECLKLYRAAQSAHTKVATEILMRMAAKPVECAREGCYNEFIPANAWQRYCSGACRQSGYARRKTGKRDR